MRRVVVLLAMMLAACSSQQSWRVPTQGIAPQSAKSPAQVVVLHEAPTKPYVELGRVGTVGDVRDDMKKFEKALAKEAAKLGADAVVVTGGSPGYTYRIGLTVHSQFTLDGVAIAWK